MKTGGPREEGVNRFSQDEKENKRIIILTRSHAKYVINNCKNSNFDDAQTAFCHILENFSPSPGP